MSEIIDSDGEIVENSISGNEPHALPEVYELAGRDLKNVAYAVEGVTDDPDAAKYAELLDNLQQSGHSIGLIQGSAVETPLSSYKAQHGFSAVPTRDPTDWELDFIESNDVMSEVTSNSTWWSEPDHVEVPLSEDGEKMPVVVTTNDYSEATYTFEEAKEIVMGVLDRIGELDSEEVEQDTDSNPNEKSGDSEKDDMSPRGQVHGVGEKIEGKMEDSFYTFTAERFPNEDEWETGIDESPYYVEDEWESPSKKREVIGGSEESTSMPDLTTGDLLERAGEVEVPEAEQKLFYQRLENDKLYDAESILQRHE